MTQADACIIVFAKAPLPGQVKTRLIPEIGADAASRLHCLLAEHGVTTAANSGMGDVQLWCAPDTRHDLFRALQQQYSISLHQQQGAGLGERMYHAFNAALVSYRHVVIVGTDCPFLRKQDYVEAIADLRQGYDAVISPAQDGGYVLLGLNRNETRLFDDMPWGTGQVCQETQARLAACHYQWKTLATLRDIDRYEDLLYLRAVAGDAGLNSEFATYLAQLVAPASCSDGN